MWVCGCVGVWVCVGVCVCVGVRGGGGTLINQLYGYVPLWEGGVFRFLVWNSILGNLSFTQNYKTQVSSLGKLLIFQK